MEGVREKKGLPEGAAAQLGNKWRGQRGAARARGMDQVGQTV